MAATTPREPLTAEENNVLSTLFARTVTLNWELIAYVVILLLAVFTRFYALGDRVMSHDESLHTVYSFNLYDRADFSHSPLMHGPILFHMTALFYFLFGVSDYTARIYVAVVGVAVVMFPLLFRRWIGRTGAVLASIMLLISPLMMYYSRYIRHDLPAILSSLFMLWAIMMYLGGPENQRRRAHWLYILAAAMLWNLGSKETAFFDIFIFGTFLAIYWLFRLTQRQSNNDYKMAFYALVIGFMLAGVVSLAMIVVFSISLGHLPTLEARFDFLWEELGNLLTGRSISVDFSTFLSWVGLTLANLLVILLGPALWAYRRGKAHFIVLDAIMGGIMVLVMILLSTLLSSTTSLSPFGEEVTVSTAAVGFAAGAIVALILSLIYATVRLEGARTFWRHFGILLFIILVTSVILINVEELSHVPSSAGETAAPVVPGQESEIVQVATDFSALPLVLVWLLAIVAIGGILYAKHHGYWSYLDVLPEFDVLVVVGSLVLPWATAIFIVLTRAGTTDFVRIGETWIGLERILPVTGAAQVGEFVIGAAAFIPMMAVAVVAGLAWNWRRWLVSAAIFHLLFAFFFTTVFTNIEGVASGMVGSLHYWLDQQEVRRGSQPQYYYLLVIMPIYEFLPIIGSVLAMIAGMVLFWRKRQAMDDDMMLATALDSEEMESGMDESSPTGGAQEEGQTAEFQREPTKRKASLASWQLGGVPFLLIVSWWGVLNSVGYTLAGEKMPWLGTHMTVPLILLAGWYFGRVIDGVDKRKFLDKGWILLLVLPLLFIAVAQIVLPFLGSNPPFSGSRQEDLDPTNAWLATAFVAAVLSYCVYWLLRFVGWRHLRQMVAVVSFTLLGIFTFRAAWAAAFINYDEATEYLVYAHGAPGNKLVTDLLSDISIRTTGGMDARILYDNKFSWPGSWYMRDFNQSVFIGENAPTLQQLDNAIAVIVGDDNRPKVEPLVEDRFQRFDYMRLWWPMQDYFGLNATRVNNLFNLSDSSAAARRRGIFDIWWSRDYSSYGNAIGRTFELTEWPVSDEMSLYLRKDIAAQVWTYGIGGGTVENPFTAIEENVCVTNWSPREATVVFDTSSHLLLRPLGLSVGPDGLVYVAEEGNHRIAVFTPDGQFVYSFGEQGRADQPGAYFERPHSVAIDPSGEILVVDTWNYLVRRFDQELTQMTSWGRPLTQGFDAPALPDDGFWGPRDIVIDDQSRVYIADTGNKRVRVYDAAGGYVLDIGSGGAGDGQLNEPAGIAVHPDGRLFVADTWNRRIAVFSQDGDHLYNFDIRGWYDELGNRPYLAVDPLRDLVYVTDPDAGRVLIYNTAGECVSSFGQYNQQAPSRSQFATVGGIAVDAEGNVYVTDFANGRVLRFDPYELPPTEIEDVDAVRPDSAEDDSADNQAEATPEVSLDVDPGSEATEELDSSD